MTHKAISEPWTPEEEHVVIRSIRTSTKPITQAIKEAAPLVDRSEKAVAYRWYTTLKNVRNNDESTILSEADKLHSDDPFTEVRLAKTFTSLRGEVFLKQEDAFHDNIQYILEEMENAETLYDYMTGNKEKIMYILNSK